MEIDADKCNSSMLKIAKIELKKRGDKIVDLECDLVNAKRGSNILLLCVFIVTILAVIK